MIESMDGYEMTIKEFYEKGLFAKRGECIQKRDIPLLLDNNFALSDTVFLKTDPVGMKKRVYQDDDVDIRGIPRSYYREIAKQKRKKYGIKKLYSIGFYRNELFSSVEYVDSFSGEQKNVDDEIEYLKETGCKIIEIEKRKDILLVWFEL